jgi:PAS domain S-box-containing protein
MKILVVGNDEASRPALKELCDRYTYAVDWVDDGEAGLEMLAAFDYDLLVIDVITLGEDEIVLCQQVRSHGSRIPLVLLTATDSGTQKAAALNAGADDCVVKPFDPEELIARIRALRRRDSAFASSRLAWGELWINSNRRLAAYGEHLLALTPKEYVILELLFRHRHRPLNATTLLDYGWDSTMVPGEETIRGYVKTLRKKLTQVGAPTDLIKTIHRVGYQLNSQYEAVPSSEQTSSSEVIDLMAALDFTHGELRVALEELLVNQTELKQQHQALDGSQARLDDLQCRYRSLLSHIAEGCIVSDAQGFIRDANPAAGKLLGTTVQQLIGRSLRLFIPKAHHLAFQEHLEAAFREPHSWIVAVPLSDGTCLLELLPDNTSTIQSGSTKRQWLLRPQSSG